ncbi:MAG: VPLPA-CTERM sorting domain-containing protein [Pseudomonadota bacterium]
MKKILLALGFTLAAVSAQAATITMGDLQLETNGAIVFSGDTHDVINVGGVDATSGLFGQLSALQDTTFAVTFLGKEADRINFYVSNGTSVAGSANNVSTVGQTFFFEVAAGVIDFGFRGPELTASNTDANNQRIAYITNDGSYIDANTNSPFAFLIGFNDGDEVDGDYDDYVVGVSAVSAVPVPAALPLMASALGAFGIARRRNKAKVAK